MFGKHDLRVMKPTNKRKAQKETTWENKGKRSLNARRKQPGHRRKQSSGIRGKQLGEQGETI